MKAKNLADLARTILRDPSVKVTFGGSTSYFLPGVDKNGKKTVHINIAKIDATPEGIIVMCGLVFHEVGHIHTDGKKPQALLGEMWNVIEDVRTELLTIKERPGASFSLEAVTNHYHEKGSFEPKDLSQAIMGKTMAYGRGRVLNQQAILPLEAFCDEMMDDAFGQSFIDDVEDILKGYTSLKNAADTTKMAKQLIDLLVQQQAQAQQQAQQQQQCQQGGQGSGQGQSQQQGQGQSGQDEDQDDQSDSQDQDDKSQNQSKGGKQEEQEDADSESGNGQTGSQSDQDGDDPSAGSGSSSSDDDDSDSQDDTQSNLGGGAGFGGGNRPTAEEIEEMLKGGSGYGDIGKLMQEELEQLAEEAYQAGDHEMPEWPVIGKLNDNRPALDESAAMAASSRMRAKMGSLLFAAKRLPVSNGTSGRKLKTNRLVRMLTCGDTKIFSKKVQEAAPNSVVVIVEDSSGSMQRDNRYAIANQAAFALNSCLYSLNGVKCATIEFGEKNQDDNINLVCDFGEKPKSSRFNIPPYGGTPTADAIWAARGMLLQRPEPRKIMLILTDGQPNDYEPTVGATAKSEKDGIEIVAIGIQCPDVRDYWKNNRVIHSMADLPTAMFGTMEELLTRRPGGAA